MGKYTHIIFLGIVIALYACAEDLPDPPQNDLIDIPYQPETYEVVMPEGFPVLETPENNPMTVAGVDLGRHLFYDPILSRDSTVSCSSCHIPELAFTDGRKFSPGIEGRMGLRNSMSLVNVGLYYNGLFWDGRATSLEDQSLHPIEDPLEMDHDIPSLVEMLRTHPTYPTKFRQAFGIQDRSQINKDLMAKALAQFERIIIAGDSKFDQFQRGETFLSDEEDLGHSMFFDFDDGLKDAECNHCHSVPLFTANTYHNNGLDSVGNNFALFEDIGLGINGIVGDTGKFRAPTLRNIALTAPYMHDGRFSTLEDVVDHYNMGIQPALNKDPLVSNLNITVDQKEAIVAFMHALTDTSYLLIPEVHSPF